MSGTVEDPGVVAGEYVLGLLSPLDMRRVEADAAADPVLAAEIVFWEDHLEPLSALVPPITPPLALWSRLALATGVGGAMDTTSVRRTNGSRAWQGATAAALAIAACFAYLAFLPHPPTPDALSPQFAAALAPVGGTAPFLALARADGSLSIVPLATARAAAGRDYQLWALPAGATRPVSLGVLAPGTAVVRPAERPSTDEQLLVSDEPAGGSPSGQPTGAVLFGGKLTAINSAPAPGR